MEFSAEDILGIGRAPDSSGGAFDVNLGGKKYSRNLVLSTCFLCVHFMDEIKEHEGQADPERPDEIVLTGAPAMAYAELDENGEKSYNRTLNSYRRLKKKGLLFSDTHEFIKRAKESPVDFYDYPLTIFSTAMWQELLPVIAISERSWLLACDCLMAAEERDAFFRRDGLHTLHLERHLPLLVLLGFLTQVGSEFAHITKRLQETSDDDDGGGDPIGKRLESLLEERSEIHKALDEARLEISRLNGLLEKKNEEIEKMRASWRKEADSLHHEISVLKAEQDADDRESGADDSVCGIPAQVLADGCVSCPDMEDRGKYDGIALPENAVFAGGHPNMVKRLKQDHPSWRFISAEDRTFSDFSSADCVFYWYKHMSHVVYDRLKTLAARNGIPELYLDSTGYAPLEREMRAKWGKHLERKGGGEL